ncbi:MAG TPA: ATP-binding protein [Acidothermaceae bacterium]
MSSSVTPLPHAAPAPPERTMPTEVRDALSWLAHVLDESLPLRSTEDTSDFAHRRLNRGGIGLITLHEQLGPLTAGTAAHAFGNDMRRFPPVEVAGLYSSESPRWKLLDLADDIKSVPSGLVAAFAAGTLAEADLVVSISIDGQYKAVNVNARAEDAKLAQAYLNDLRRRSREADSYLRGRCLRVRGDGESINVTPMKAPTAKRSDVIVSEAVWRELDLNVSALFARRELLTKLRLGTNRGMLLYGPPGTGKTALCRVLAAELVGDVTVVLCDARAIGVRMGEVYQELSRLAPALIVLEDLDLVVGNRRLGRSGGLHDFLAALDGVMSNHDGIVTVATTNDIKALDDAAVRTARFDRIIEVPLPDAGLRALILTRYLGSLASAIDVRAVAAATDGASGAVLRELVRRAVLVEGDAFTTATLLRVARDGLGATTTGQYL